MTPTSDPPAKVPKKKDDEKHMSFLEHLDELRTCLINVILGIAVFSIFGYFMTDPVLQFLVVPLQHKTETPNPADWFKPPKDKPPPRALEIEIAEDGTLRVRDWAEWRASKDAVKRLERGESPVELTLPPAEPDGRELTLTLRAGRGTGSSELIYLSPLTPFMLKIKTAILIGLLISLPWTLYQIWIFIKPGLRFVERKYTKRIIVSALFLFPIGSAFAYFMAPFALAFLEKFGFPGLIAQLEVGKYLSIVLTMMIAMGCVFELPLVMLFLVRLGIVSTAQLRRYRRQCIVGILLISAIFTPPDIFTMIVMAIPLVFLFEASLIICDILVPPSRQRSSWGGDDSREGDAA